VNLTIDVPDTQVHEYFYYPHKGKSDGEFEVKSKFTLKLMGILHHFVKVSPSWKIFLRRGRPLYVHIPLMDGDMDSNTAVRFYLAPKQEDDDIYQDNDLSDDDDFSGMEEVEVEEEIMEEND
jgi:hypothetical protein